MKQFTDYINNSTNKNAKFGECGYKMQMLMRLQGNKINEL